MSLPRPPAPGSTAPAFVLPDLEGVPRRPLDGGPGSGGKVLIVFFKDDCPTCRYTLPVVGRIDRALGARGARIFGVAQDDAVRSRAFAREHGLEFPILTDAPDHAVSRAFGIATVPTLVLAAGDGIVARTVSGFGRTEIEAMARDLAEGIGAPVPRLFQGEDEVPETRPG